MTNDLEIYRGDTASITITVTDADGSAFNLTGYEMKMTAKKTEDDLDADATIGTLTGTITDAAGGIGTISMASTDTNVSPGDYVYDVQVYNSSNSNLFTVVKDHLTIVADVTRAE